jgi:hypothetical protein
LSPQAVQKLKSTHPEEKSGEILPLWKEKREKKWMFQPKLCVLDARILALEEVKAIQAAQEKTPWDSEVVPWEWNQTSLEIRSQEKTQRTSQVSIKQLHIVRSENSKFLGPTRKYTRS